MERRVFFFQQKCHLIDFWDINYMVKATPWDTLLDSPLSLHTWPSHHRGDPLCLTQRDLCLTHGFGVWRLSAKKSVRFSGRNGFQKNWSLSSKRCAVQPGMDFVRGGGTERDQTPEHGLNTVVQESGGLAQKGWSVLHLKVSFFFGGGCSGIHERFASWMVEWSFNKQLSMVAVCSACDILCLWCSVPLCKVPTLYRAQFDSLQPKPLRHPKHSNSKIFQHLQFITCISHIKVPFFWCTPRSRRLYTSACRGCTVRASMCGFG